MMSHMKRINNPYRYYRIYQLILLMVCWLLVPLAQAAGEPAIQSKGILWKIEGGKVAPSYLLGTIHSDDPRVLKLPAPVAKAMQDCRSLSLEVIPSVENQIIFAKSMRYTDGRTLEQVVGQVVYRRIVKAAKEYGIPEINLVVMKPWAVMLILSLPKPSTGLVLDFQLYQNAKKAGKRVYGLETIYEQVMIFDSLKLPEQIHLLTETLNNFQKLPQIIEQLIQAYLARNLQQMLHIAEKYENAKHPINKKLRYALLDKRNRLMLRRMLPRLREGNACIAVGSLHLPGANGLLRLLKNKGYRVTPVY